MTIGETHKEFKRENPLSQIGKSTFASLRPKHMLLNSDMPHNVCGCKYHNNMLLILECLHRTTDFIPLHLDEFIDLCICNKSSETVLSMNVALVRMADYLRKTRHERWAIRCMFRFNGMSGRKMREDIWVSVCRMGRQQSGNSPETPITVRLASVH